VEKKKTLVGIAGLAQLAHHATWLDPIDDREMVQPSVANLTAARVQTNMWDQYCINGSHHS